MLLCLQMAQELNIIEQEENFQNPYREETMMEVSDRNYAKYNTVESLNLCC